MEQNIPLTKEQMIDNLFAQLTLKKAEVASATKPMFITGGLFRYSEGMTNQTDITTVRDERKLVEIAAFLKERAKSYKESAVELGCDVAFTWLGFTQEEWFADLKTRVNVLQLSKRRSELIELETRLNKIVPQEMRDAMEMKELMKALQ